MNIFRKLQLSFPTAKKRMVRIETLPIAASQALHLIRVDAMEYLVVAGNGNCSIVPFRPALNDSLRAVATERG